MSDNLLKSPHSEPSLDNGDVSRRKRVLIGCTGSVAAIKTAMIGADLLRQGVDVRIILTESARHFFRRDDFEPREGVFTDEDEWGMWKGRGDPVLHIDLAKWADLFLVAPLDANTLAKLAQGLCDNLLTCVARAWDPKKPLVFCPAMNTQMWDHPLTSTHISALQSWGYRLVPCVTKTLMCGDTGLGAMAEPGTIVGAVAEILGTL
uniref:Phosphopantothenoylcysteine decarboxylase n=1 Tax=Timema genevievae TaxID=629358 RepID=A0A7R9JVW6_TIMGE|nr:unnamed protein product [Timema genevievae]